MFGQRGHNFWRWTEVVEVAQIRHDEPQTGFGITRRRWQGIVA